MNNLMIDIETLGTKPGSVIASIGAVFFNPATGETGAEFEVLISVEASKKLGLTTDAATVAWWDKQSKNAQQQLQGSLSPELAMDDFLQFVISHCERDKVKAWGNGASFDPVLIEAAFDKCNQRYEVSVEAPFKYWNIRDVRTLVDLGREIGFDPKRDMPFDGVPHSALADAKHQAKYVSAIWQALLGR
ncbi:3'-5' exonuclease [Thiomicrorhabdus aquaedulcis]|uniref:3'-5' exonuclease n=1 Tax=Thiomicrorhabdus aquaedulcis TaxID=2211106 RepID=UPI000FD80DA3|nr:3'-5' exonuclease [Thiomicrorhabdus aquaedulcis]